MNPLTFDVRRILTWSKCNDPVGFHACPGLPKCLSWEGTRGGEPHNNNNNSYYYYYFWVLASCMTLGDVKEI